MPCALAITTPLSIHLRLIFAPPSFVWSSFPLSHNTSFFSHSLTGTGEATYTPDSCSITSNPPSPSALEAAARKGAPTFLPPPPSSRPPTLTGMGVTIYTLDSGIMASHQEFQSLIYPGYSRASGGEESLVSGLRHLCCRGISPAALTRRTRHCSPTLFANPTPERGVKCVSFLSSFLSSPL